MSLLNRLPEWVKVLNCAGCGCLMTKNVHDAHQFLRLGLRMVGGYMRERPYCFGCVGRHEVPASADRSHSPGQRAKLPKMRMED